MDPNFTHPLMLIRDLDSPDGSSSQKTPHCKTRNKFWQSRIDQSLGLIPVNSIPNRRVTRSVTRTQQSKVENKDCLSESGSEDESEDTSRPTAHTKSDADQKLLDDLRLSDDDGFSSSSSSSSSSSEITGPSDTESESSSGDNDALWTSLRGWGYFWIRSSPNYKATEIFKQISFEDQLETVVRAFKIFCRESSTDQAVCAFATKLKHLNDKKCLNLLRQYRKIFKTQVFHLEMKSYNLFGMIIMTVAQYHYSMGVFLTTMALIKFLDFTCGLDPFKHCPYTIQHKNYAQLSEFATAYMCCDAAFKTANVSCCMRYSVRLFKTAMRNSDMAAVDGMKMMTRVFFQYLISRNLARPLFLFFSNMFDLQQNLEYPLDLSEFYSATICVMVASGEHYNHKLILDLFIRVNNWICVDVNHVACRSLLIAAAELNESRPRVQLIFRESVFAGAYPHWDLGGWTLPLYSSMTKVEMQIYLEQFVQYRIDFIWTNRLPMCSTYMLFCIQPVSSSAVRDYVYPVPKKIQDVDHSVAAAMDRLKSVLQYFLQQPAEEVVERYDAYQLIMFDKAVKKLFQKVLKIDSLVKESGSLCILCK